MASSSGLLLAFGFLGETPGLTMLLRLAYHFAGSEESRPGAFILGSGTGFKLLSLSYTVPIFSEPVKSLALW